MIDYLVIIALMITGLHFLRQGLLQLQRQRDAAKERAKANNLIVFTKDIDSIVVKAFTGGINRWCTYAEYQCGPERNARLSSDSGLKLCIATKDETYTLNSMDFIKGIRLYKSKNFDKGGAIGKDGRINTTKIDVEAADCIVQLALFGHRVFGKVHSN
jgi:hypothetical protein